MSLSGSDLAGSISFIKNLDLKGTLFITANLLVKGRPFFPPFRIFKIKGLKIAVIGLTGGEIPLGFPDYKDIKILDASTSLKKYMPKVKDNSDLILLLSSLPKRTERKILMDFPEISLVISSGLTTATYLPVKINNTLIVSTHPKGKSVGIIELKLSSGKKVKVVNYKNRIIMLKEKPVIPSINPLNRI